MARTIKEITKNSHWEINEGVNIVGVRILGESGELDTEVYLTGGQNPGLDGVWFGRIALSNELIAEKETMLNFCFDFVLEKMTPE